MFKNHLKIALRNLWKERTFTLLNLIGLGVAFTCACLLTVFATYELSYDNFHDDPDRLFQIYVNEQTPRGLASTETFPTPFGPAFKEEVAGVEKLTRYLDNPSSFKLGDKSINLSSRFVDPDYFEMFNFKILSGSKNPLENKNSIALSQNAAEKLFGKEEAIGKNLQMQADGRLVNFTVTAIMENNPWNTELDFGALLNFEDQPGDDYARLTDSWDSRNHNVYMKLAPGYSIADFEKSTAAFAEKYYVSDIENAKRDGAQAFEDGTFLQLRLMNLRDLNFRKTVASVYRVDKTQVQVVIAIAVLLLIIACVNFINMSIGKAGTRMREIGMRKTLGASKNQLFLQLWAESALVFIMALVLAAGLTYLLHDPFRSLFDTWAGLDQLLQPEMIIGGILLIALVSFIAGGYPARLISGSGTIQALKGKLPVYSKNRVRNVLMVVQFAISIIFISGTLVLYSQLEFLRTSDLGYNKEQVVSVPLESPQDPQKLLDLMKLKLQNNPKILNIGGASSNLGMGLDNSSSRSYLGFEHEGREVNTYLFEAGHGYVEALDLELIAGRSFRENLAADSTSVIINEKMAAQFKEENPLDITFSFGNGPYQVVGVVKDFHFQNMDKTIEPLSIFTPTWSRFRYAFIQVAPGDLAGTLDDIKAVWNEIEPQRSFMGSFLDENIDRTLEKERTIIKIISLGAIVAIVLSCIGLFAMSLLVVAQRRKEIGIRKVVGASVARVTVLLSLDFVKLVGIAFIIAFPVAYYLTNSWLQDYPYRTELHWYIFITGGLIALFIAILTISFKTVRAAVANPVESLKSE